MERWLPSEPIEEITADALATFLLRHRHESAVLEYKSVAEAKNIPDVVAAMANSHGGLIVVGVPDDWNGDRTLLETVDHQDVANLINRFVDRLDPPWVPPHALLTVNGCSLLVLRVDVTRAPRPILSDGKALGRFGPRNGPLGLDRLRSLMLGQSPLPLVPNASSHSPHTAPSFTGEGTGLPEFLVRIVSGLPAWPGQLALRLADTAMRNALRVSLEGSPLLEAMAWIAPRYSAMEPTPWADAGPSRAHTAAFASTALSTTARKPRRRLEAHVLIDFSQSAIGGGGLAVRIDIGLWPTAAAEDASIARYGAIRQNQLEVPRLNVQDVASLLVAALRACDAVIDRCRGVLFDDAPAGRPVPPSGWITAVRGLERVWDLSAVDARTVAPDELGNERFLDAPSSLPLDTEAAAQVVDIWIRAIVHDSGRVMNTDGPVFTLPAYFTATGVDP